MPKSKSISEQILKMQEASERLKQWEKLFDRACQMRFGTSAKSIEKLLQEKRISAKESHHEKGSIDPLFDKQKEG